MKNSLVKNSSLVIFSLLISACTWVELSEQAKTIMLVSSDQVSHCKKIGNISAKTRAHIAGTARSNKKMLNELSILARNEAVKINANRIVAETPPQKGEQTFAAYQCSE